VRDDDEEDDNDDDEEQMEMEKRKKKKKKKEKGEKQERRNPGDGLVSMTFRDEIHSLVVFQARHYFPEQSTQLWNDFYCSALH
jgi:hypothetical protein